MRYTFRDMDKVHKESAGMNLKVVLIQVDGYGIRSKQRFELRHIGSDK